MTLTAKLPKKDVGGRSTVVKSAPAFSVSIKTIELKTEDFINFRDFIHEKCGMFFHENKMYLIKNRLSNRMNQLGIKNFKDYFYMVKYDTSLKEFNVLMNLLTTNETSFFRNLPQITAFSDEVLPMVIKEKAKTNNKNLRIWSAGCSTGEEPFTLSMTVMEKIPNWQTYNIEIIANDISLDVLQAARKGIYHELSLRTTPKYYKDKYFTKKGSVYHINDIVKKLIQFSQINMTDSLKMSLIKNIDIIFCRNVTIYFSDEVKRKITKSFYSSLVKNGYYFIGHSESLHGISKAFKLVYLKNGLVYKKE
ncbi:MAG: protein-glutamate O-methyltransferase CheR [candidate division Zixibacteria bacterium]|nr:protein-glutamate O-methyltransferase CheR [candidate division Zixibacteria bacterium]